MKFSFNFKFILAIISVILSAQLCAVNAEPAYAAGVTTTAKHDIAMRRAIKSYLGYCAVQKNKDYKRNCYSLKPLIAEWSDPTREPNELLRYELYRNGMFSAAEAELAASKVAVYYFYLKNRVPDSLYISLFERALTRSITRKNLEHSAVLRQMIGAIHQARSNCYQRLAGKKPSASEIDIITSYKLCSDQSPLFSYNRMPINLPIEEAAVIYAYELALLELKEPGRGHDPAVREFDTLEDLYTKIFAINSILSGTEEKKCVPAEAPPLLLSVLNAEYTKNLQVLMSPPFTELFNDPIDVPDFISLKAKTAAILMAKANSKSASSLEAVVSAKFLADLDDVFELDGVFDWADKKGKGFLADRPTDGANDIHFDVRTTIDCLRLHIIPLSGTPIETYSATL